MVVVVLVVSGEDGEGLRARDTSVVRALSGLDSLGGLGGYGDQKDADAAFCA